MGRAGRADYAVSAQAAQIESVDYAVSAQAAQITQCPRRPRRLRSVRAGRADYAVSAQAAQIESRADYAVSAQAAQSENLAGTARKYTKPQLLGFLHEDLTPPPPILGF